VSQSVNGELVQVVVREVEFEVAMEVFDSVFQLVPAERSDSSGCFVEFVLG